MLNIIIKHVYLKHTETMHREDYRRMSTTELKKILSFQVGKQLRNQEPSKEEMEDFTKNYMKILKNLKQEEIIKILMSLKKN